MPRISDAEMLQDKKKKSVGRLPRASADFSKFDLQIYKDK